MKNQMQNQMDNEMEARIARGYMEYQLFQDMLQGSHQVDDMLPR